MKDFPYQVWADDTFERSFKSLSQAKRAAIIWADMHKKKYYVIYNIFGIGIKVYDTN